MTITNIQTLEELRDHFVKNDGTGFVMGKWSDNPEVEARLSEMGVTVRCLPLEQSSTEGRCLVTGGPAQTDAVFAKGY
jgi:prolyl-tRNA synthetase